jgi:hypothetical protein
MCIWKTKCIFDNKTYWGGTIMRYNVPYFVTKGFYVIIDKSIVTYGFKG